MDRDQRPARRAKKTPPKNQPSQPKKLTQRQQRFVDALIGDPRITPTEAARRAGFGEKSANRTAWDLLNEPENSHVQAELARRQVEQAKELDVSADEIKQDIDRYANLNPKRLFEVKDGITIPKPIDQLTDDEAALIKEIKVTMTPYGPNVNYKMHDRLVARTVQAKMKGLLKDQVEHSGVIDLGGDVRESLLRKLRTVFDAVAAEETPGASSPEPN